MFDMWSDLFASPGTRTSGNWPAHFGVVARGFEGELPPGVRRLETPTPYAWIAGRTQCESERKFAYENAFQKRLLLTPLSQWGRAPSRAPARGAPVDLVPARERVDAMCAPEFFAGAAELFKLHPAHAHDQDMLLRMERVGFVAGESFDVDALPRAVADCLHSARAEAQLELHRRAQALGRRSKGWLVATEAHGACGTDFLRRAATSRIALGAPASEDVVPATARVDGSGRVLRGTNGYLLRFERHELPPVRGFWSLTLYDDHGRPVPNELDRHSLCDGLERGDDGSLELTIQQSPPRNAPVSNWLPSPPGRFTLCLRLLLAADRGARRNLDTAARPAGGRGGRLSCHAIAVRSSLGRTIMYTSTPTSGTKITNSVQPALAQPEWSGRRKLSARTRTSR